MCLLFILKSVEETNFQEDRLNHHCYVSGYKTQLIIDFVQKLLFYASIDERVYGEKDIIIKVKLIL